ncbi:cation-transporting P-type ATPase [Cupriavidus necator]
MAALSGADDGAGPRLPVDDDEPPAHNRPTAATPGRHGEPHASEAASLPPALSWAAEHEASEILDRLAATDAGLTEREAADRLATCGPNRIAASQGQHCPASLARRLGGPVNLMLIVLSALSVFVHDYSAAALIGGMIVLSVTPATWQETRSDRAVAALRTMVTPSTQERPISELVPGDIIHLAAGDLVPTSGCWPRRTCS